MRLSAAAAVVAALGLAACGATKTANTATPGSSAATPSATQTVGPPPAPSATTTATLTPTATATTPATTSGAAPAPAPTTVTTTSITTPDSGGAGLSTVTTGSSECVAADLTPAAVPPNSAPGTTVLGFTLKNSGSSACHTYGWPGIALVSASGTVADTQATRSTGDALGQTPATAFTLKPGDEASFRITLHDSGSGCGSYTGVQIIAPNDTATLRATIPDGPVQSCGSVAVSPLEPGDTATGQ